MEIKDKKHILYNSQKNKEKYFDDFNLTITELKKKLSYKKFKNLVDSDLQIKKNFEEQKYFQFAAETTINRYFSKNFKYTYEPKSSTGNKNMDCGIEYKGVKYNFEVKCPTISSKEEDTLYTCLGSGFKDYKEVDKVINDIKNIVKQGNISYKKVSTHIDVGGKNSQKKKLFELLKATDEKSIKGEVNILILSLYSKSNFSEWSYNFLEILNNPKQIEEFKNVDGIIITNTLNCHVNYKNTLINPWNWEEHLSFFILNIYKENNDQIIKTLIEEIIPYKENLLLAEKIDQVRKLMIFENKKEIYKEKLIYISEILNSVQCKDIRTIVPYTSSFLLKESVENKDVEIKLNNSFNKLKKIAHEKFCKKRGVYFNVKMMFLATEVINEIETEKKYFINDENYDTFKQS